MKIIVGFPQNKHSVFKHGKIRPIIKETGCPILKGDLTWSSTGGGLRRVSRRGGTSVDDEGGKIWTHKEDNI